MSSPLDSRGPAWREWIVGNLRAGCDFDSLLKAMVGPQWDEPTAREALRLGLNWVDQRDTIFVSVAAFCDPHLLHTIADATRKARHPHALVFAVVDQDPEDRRARVREAAGAAALRYVRVAPSESRGVCWARSLAFSLFQDETFLLQIDSHMHFEPGWDETLRQAWADLAAHGNPRRVLTGYPPSFEFHDGVPVPGSQPEAGTVMVLRPRREARLSDEDLRMGFITEYVAAHEPVRACHIAGGFLFAHGSFVHEVPYDPYLYFSGEEQSLALRAYTRGWDLWHPVRMPLYHLYKAPNTEHRNHHWHPDWQSQRDFHWGDLDLRSRDRLVDMIDARRDLGGYNLGTQRSLQQYAREFGIDYPARRVGEPGVDPGALDEGGPSWREWIVGNLGRGCTVDSLVQQMLGPQWSEERARAAIRAGQDWLRQHAA